MDTNVDGIIIHDHGQQVDQDREKARKDLEKRYTKVWDTKELQEDFIVVGFGAPVVVVERRSDGVRGTLEFTHSPRFYFDFVSERKR